MRNKSIWSEIGLNKCEIDLNESEINLNKCEIHEHNVILYISITVILSFYLFTLVILKSFLGAFMHLNKSKIDLNESEFALMTSSLRSI